MRGALTLLLAVSLLPTWTVAATQSSQKEKVPERPRYVMLGDRTPQAHHSILKGREGVIKRGKSDFLRDLRRQAVSDALKVSNREFTYIFVPGIVLMLCYGYLLFRVSRYVRRKGYHSPFRFGLLMLVYLVMLFGGFFYASHAPGQCSECTPADNPAYFQPEMVWPHVRYS
jgi:hypothetical protein